MAQKVPVSQAEPLALATPKERISSIPAHLLAPYTTRNSVLQPTLSLLLKGTWVPKTGSKYLPHYGGKGKNTVSSQAAQIPQVLARLVDQLNFVDVETEAESQQATFQRLEGNQGRPASQAWGYLPVGPTAASTRHTWTACPRRLAQSPH